MEYYLIFLVILSFFFGCLSGLALIFGYTLIQIKGVVCARDFVKTQWVGDRQREVHMVFVRCRDKEVAFQQAKDKGLGAEPEHHGPHRNAADFYSHYHPGNHELFYEDGRWINYHYYYGTDRYGNQG